MPRIDPHHYTTDPWKNLACAIVLQATDDWMALCGMVIKGKADANGVPYKTLRHPIRFSFLSLRRFFRSSYCATLCGRTNPRYILDELERRRVNSIMLRKIMQDKPKQINYRGRKLADTIMKIL